MKYFSKYLIPVYLSSILFSQDQFSLSFDGNDDYVNIPDNATLDLTGSYTLEAWIKAESFTWLGGIISKYHTNASNGYTLSLTDQAPYDGIGFDGKITSTGLIDTSVWYHIAAVNDGGFSHKLYLNGVEVPLSGSAHS